MTFYQYCLRTYQGTDTPGADILRDMQRDPGFPRKASTRRTVMNYIQRKSARSSCANAFSEALTEYEIIRPPISALKPEEYAMSFFDFILLFFKGFEPSAGSIFWDIKNDPDFPRFVSSRKELLAYVDSKGRSPNWRSRFVSFLHAYESHMVYLAKERAKQAKRAAKQAAKQAKQPKPGN
ncbi:MAG: hypothetical protein GX674_07510 [Clostridiales bacterium]|nr:hypothetical protein [Clostridiales bacterium]